MPCIAWSFLLWMLWTQMLHYILLSRKGKPRQQFPTHADSLPLLPTTHFWYFLWTSTVAHDAKVKDGWKNWFGFKLSPSPGWLWPSCHMSEQDRKKMNAHPWSYSTRQTISSPVHSKVRSMKAQVQHEQKKYFFSKWPRKPVTNKGIVLAFSEPLLRIHRLQIENV